MKRINLFFIIPIFIAITLLPVLAQENVVVLREVAQWKFSREEKVVVSFFPCVVVDCQKLGITDGLYKAYFPDGFVLSLDKTGKVLEAYYLVSPNNQAAFNQNLELYGKIGLEQFSEKVQKRIKLLKAEAERISPELVKYLMAGKYPEALSEIEKSLEAAKGEGKEASGKTKVASLLGLRSFVYYLIGDNEKAGQQAQEALSLGSDNQWAKRAAAIVCLVKGQDCDRALSLLSPSDEVDGLLQVLIYSKQGQLQKAVEVFLALADEISGREEAFLENLADKARTSLSPYAAAKMAEAENLEKNGQLAEALKIYGQVMKLAEDEQAKKLRTHLSEIYKAHPEFREMPEEARKYYVRSEVMNREGKFLESLTECRKALKIAPLSPDLYKALALNCAKLEKFKLAVANMNIYLELFPDAPDARAAKDLIYQWEYLLEEKGK
ncbi:MAG: hypothetical protein ACP5J6_06780 [Candidatus Saccharicenans sp.]